MADAQGACEQGEQLKNVLFGACIAAATLCVVAPAHAGVSEDFRECDGLKKPKGSDDGMRGVATFPAYSFGDVGAPSRTLAACNRALESGKLLPEQNLRRAHILRARAAAKLELSDVAGAMVDLDGAESAGKTYAADPSYDRSMGVSLSLLRSIAYNDLGNKAESLALAEASASKRPFAVEVQWAATTLRSANGESRADPAIWSNILKLDPASRTLHSQMSQKPDDLAAIAKDAGVPTVVFAKAPPLQTLLVDGAHIARITDEWGAPISKAMTTAYALAANGKSDAARAWVNAARVALEAASSLDSANGGEKNANTVDNVYAPLLQIVRASNFDPMVKLIDARIAVTEGRLPEAAGLIKDMQLRSTPVTEEFYASYATARAASGAGITELPPLIPAGERGPVKLASLGRKLLISPESKRKQIDYEKSRPNVVGALVGAAFSLGTSLLGGIDRTAGFRSTPNTDGSIKVEYTGNTTSGPVVQEMTLLRAAEVATEAGKTHFQIINRRDYQRYLTQTMYGVETERTLTGYKTELDIRILNDGDDVTNAFKAEEIINALGPVYYESKAQA